MNPLQTDWNRPPKQKLKESRELEEKLVKRQNTLVLGM